MNSAGAPGWRPLAAWWLVLCVFCLAIHWLGFRAWFRADDFAWLGLTPTVHDAHDLLLALFQPRAQGTIRPWSERAFFMAGYALFGLNALPYRAVIFATQFADLFLVVWIGRRLTGSLAAGVCAAALWTINSSGMEPLGWACVYNEVLCAFFLLLALFCLLRYIDTGQRRYNVAQWVVFILGFGALESNIVYPALAGAYTFLCARKYFARTLPLFAVSAAYAVVHSLEAPVPKTGEYAMHFGASLLVTLKTLWSWSVGPTYLSSPLSLPPWLVAAGVAALTVALLWFVFRRWRGGTALFFLSWYLIAVAPMLPLRDHVTEYYVYIPVIGLCWLGGWALVEGWRSGILPRAAAAAALLVYGFLQVPQLVASTEWNYILTVRTRNLVEGVAGAHERHPSQAILLQGVDGDLFWNAVRDHPFRLVGIEQVYLSPETAQQAAGHSEWEGVDQFILPGQVAGKAIARNELVVYDVRGPQLRNVTSLYAALPHDNQLPLRVDVGSPLTADLLGPEWYRIEDSHRWMPQRATLKMGGPRSVNQKLHLSFYCSDEGFSRGTFDVTPAIDGITLTPFRVQPGQNSFEPEFAIPPQFVGKPQVQILIQVSRTFRPAADPRELGLAFGTVEIR